MNTSLYLFTRTILFSAILSLLSCNKSVSTSNNNELEYADSMYAKYMSLKTKTGLNNINVDLISLKYDSTYYKQAQTDIKYLEDYYTNWIQLLNNLDEPELLDSNDSTRTQFRLIISDDQLPHVRLIRVEFLNDQVSVIKKELNNSSISSMPVLKGSTHLDENFDKIGFSAQINSIKNENLTTIDLNSNQYNGIKYTFEYCDGRNKNYFKIIRYSNPDSICKKLFNKMEEL